MYILPNKTGINLKPASPSRCWPYNLLLLGRFEYVYIYLELCGNQQPRSPKRGIRALAIHGPTTTTYIVLLVHITYCMSHTHPSRRFSSYYRTDFRFTLFAKPDFPPQNPIHTHIMSTLARTPCLGHCPRTATQMKVVHKTRIYASRRKDRI